MLNLRVTSGDFNELTLVPDAPPAPARLTQVRREMLADFCKMLVTEARLRPRSDKISGSSNGTGNGHPNGASEARPNGNEVNRRSRVVEVARGHADADADADVNSGVNSHLGPLFPAAISAATVIDAPHLSRRLRQTLDRLLAGDGEKQIARHLGLSRHTVHVYIKALYRCFGVNSRGELLARFVANAPA